MTEITIHKKGKRHVLDIKGHAGYAEHGKDIVCAGISTLAYTLINQLRELEKQELASEVSYCEENGRVIIAFGIESEAAKIAFETVMTGFYMLEKKFFLNVRVKGEK